MNYYYLISSLPDMSPQMDASNLDFDDLFDMIRRNLTKEDKKLLRYLIYPNDINNLLSILCQEYKDLPTATFKKPSVFNLEDIKAYKLGRKNFPDFMNDFLAENEDRLANMSPRDMEDAITDRFYNEVFGLDNTFLANYFAFVRELKSLIAAFHFNTYDFLSQPNIHDADRLILQVGPDRSPSALVTKDYPYLNALIKVLLENKPEKIERFLDTVIWDFLEEKTQGLFGAEDVFAYTIKLQIIQRWTIIDSSNGQEYFEKLLHKIINDVTSKKTPAI